MAVHRLYKLSFYEEVLQRGDPSSRRRQAVLGTLQDAVGDVQTIASEPGDRALTGVFRQDYAELMAREVQELLSSGDAIEAVPYFDVETEVEWRGYYSPREVRNAGRRDPAVTSAAGFEGSLDLAGTRGSHFRRVVVHPSSDNTVTNPFGSATTETLFLADTASDVQWVDLPDGTVEDATVQATHAGRDATFAEYDVTEPSFASKDSYELVYALPYADERGQDPTVWDTYGNDETEYGDYSGDTVGSATVGSASVGSQTEVYPAWQRVYLPQHPYRGEKTIDTGRLRLEPRPGVPVLRAYRWDDAEAVYDPVQLGNTAWRLSEWDVREIGLGRIEALTTWQDTSGSSTYDLVAEVRRGSDSVLFYEPQNASGSTPADLVTRLDPVAADTDQSLQERTKLREKSEVPDE